MATRDDAEYFDLLTTGAGRVFRPRWVNPPGGNKYLAVTISGFRGKVEEPQYTKYDVSVTGEKAKKLVAHMIPHVAQSKKVLVGFVIGDAYPHLFAYEKGERAGQTGVIMRGHLLRLTWVKIDGELVYSEKQERERAASRLAVQGVDTEAEEKQAQEHQTNAAA